MKMTRLLAGSLLAATMAAAAAAIGFSGAALAAPRPMAEMMRAPSIPVYSF